LVGEDRVLETLQAAGLDALSLPAGDGPLADLGGLGRHVAAVQRSGQQHRDFSVAGLVYGQVAQFGDYLAMPAGADAGLDLGEG
jgi:hypothetical protein